MIHRRVEDAAGYGIAGLDVHLVQLPVPGFVGSSHHLAEIPARNLFLQILLGVLGAHGRHARLDQQWFGDIGCHNEPSSGA